MSPALLIVAAGLSVALFRWAFAWGHGYDENGNPWSYGDHVDEVREAGKWAAILMALGFGGYAFFGGAGGATIGGPSNSSGVVAGGGGGGSGAIDTIMVADWDAGLGNSYFALSDDTLFGLAETCNGGAYPDNARVIEADSVLGYTRTTNVLRVHYTSTNGCVHVGRHGASTHGYMFPAQDSGAVWLYAIDFANGSDQDARQLHGTADHSYYLIIECVAIEVNGFGAAGWQPGIPCGQRNGVGGGSAMYMYFNDTLPADSMFEFQNRVEWFSDSTFRVYPEWRDLSGNVRLDMADTYCYQECGPNGAISLADWYAIHPDSVLFIRNASRDSIRNFAIGQSQTGANAGDGRFYYGCARFGTATDTTARWGSC